MRVDLIFAPFARFAVRPLRRAIPSVHIARDLSVRLLDKVKGSATRAVIDGKPSFELLVRCGVLPQSQRLTRWGRRFGCWCRLMAPKETAAGMMGVNMCFRPADASASPKKCAQCGTVNAAAETVCRSCGAELSAVASPSGAPGMPPMPGSAPGMPPMPPMPGASGAPSTPKASDK